MDKRPNAVITITFSQRDCLACPVRPHCTTAQRRTITIRPEEQHRALVQTRQRQKAVRMMQ